MDNADRIKQLAIDFAKYLMEQKVTRSKSSSEIEEYIPHEFSLMRGNLELHGDHMFSVFFEEMCAKRFDNNG